MAGLGSPNVWAFPTFIGTVECTWRMILTGDGRKSLPKPDIYSSDSCVGLVVMLVSALILLASLFGSVRILQRQDYFLLGFGPSPLGYVDPASLEGPQSRLLLQTSRVRSEDQRQGYSIVNLLQNRKSIRTTYLSVVPKPITYKLHNYAGPRCQYYGAPRSTLPR